MTQTETGVFRTRETEVTHDIELEDGHQSGTPGDGSQVAADGDKSPGIV